MITNLYLISDVARRLDVPPHRIAYLMVSGKVEEPALRLGNRRMFTDADAGRVAAVLGRTWEDKSDDRRLS